MIDARGPLSDSLTECGREREHQRIRIEPCPGSGPKRPQLQGATGGSRQIDPPACEGTSGAASRLRGRVRPPARRRTPARARSRSLARIGGAAEGRRARREVKLRAPGVCAAASAVSTTEDPAPPPPPPRHLVSLSRPAASARPAAAPAHAPHFLSPPREFSHF